MSVQTRGLRSFLVSSSQRRTVDKLEISIGADIRLLSVEEPSGVMIVMLNILAGLFVGSTAIGAHEITTKVMKKNAKS